MNFLIACKSLFSHSLVSLISSSPQSIRDRFKLVIEPEEDIHTTITNLKDIDQYGDAVYEG